jgi:hypothetical protein
MPPPALTLGPLVCQSFRLDLSLVLIANLVDERMAVSAQYIDRLPVCVEDTSFKVRVAGDLNASKSTFANALRREVMAVGQQSRTVAFWPLRMRLPTKSMMRDNVSASQSRRST